MLGRLRTPVAKLSARLMSTEARPMTRFVQYPFDKTKMAEVREWVNSSGLIGKIRSQPGVKDVEVSFCPGEGWLAARYIFNDLEDLKTFLGNTEFLEAGKAEVTSSPHYDATREPREFKGFFLPEV
mmetsp:Transcript_23362/g.59004  ORF Transcript_23362/g.59004 Transcript_23362/m.59004 type:complete len:126 (+) Transcript_23362:115-492(+)